jgi:hypothetical protein
MGFLIGIGLIVLTFILIVRIFSGSPKVTPKTINLNSYSTTDTVMRLTMDGPVVANQLHQQARITVGRDQVLFESLKGYQGDVAATKSYDNNPDAYTQFLHALTISGFTLGDLKVGKDERGYCPAGTRYVYEAIGDGQDILRWWSTSCGGGLGNFKGRPSDIRRLFITQVPDYDTLTRKTVFN